MPQREIDATNQAVADPVHCCRRPAMHLSQDLDGTRALSGARPSSRSTATKIRARNVGSDVRSTATKIRAQSAVFGLRTYSWSARKSTDSKRHNEDQKDGREEKRGVY